MVFSRVRTDASRSPRPACGERSDRIADAIRVRGTLRELRSLKEPLPPTLSPRRAGRGRSGRCNISLNSSRSGFRAPPKTLVADHPRSRGWKTLAAGRGFLDQARGLGRAAAAARAVRGLVFA